MEVCEFESLSIVVKTGTKELWKKRELVAGRSTEEIVVNKKHETMWKMWFWMNVNKGTWKFLKKFECKWIQ